MLNDRQIPSYTQLFEWIKEEIPLQIKTKTSGNNFNGFVEIKAFDITKSIRLNHKSWEIIHSNKSNAYTLITKNNNSVDVPIVYYTMRDVCASFLSYQHNGERMFSYNLGGFEVYRFAVKTMGSNMMFSFSPKFINEKDLNWHVL